MESELKIIVIAVFACACTFAAVADEHVGRNLEKGEPARWQEPADTPQKRAQLADQEARAALAEALKECRAQKAERAACEKQAREQYRLDTEAARALPAKR
ncbi:MAG TPA: hypothetical protein VFJ62_17350 [Usitatibacter sp.]|nr:hypothetical protein [Usitatibacter sp.]